MEGDVHSLPQPKEHTMRLLTACIFSFFLFFLFQ